ncbi:cupin domain-containing protein [Citrobacter portucalensis]|uniref:cupin domain-containing protein n=1 Tax=Citrobacter portucalensis TaxID=1639133 RepID=UPI001F1554F4|nr:cupin domain-containing protein [Citrobacter portucalensis]
MSECKTECNVKKGNNFTAYETGARSDWPAHTVELPGLTIPGKKFLKDMLGLTSCEISINSMAPGAGMPIYHNHHQNEEVYIFIQGKGQVQVDGEVINVQEGTMVRIAPNGERIWRNNSNEPLLYIIIQAKENSLVQYGLHDATVPEKAAVWPN